MPTHKFILNGKRVKVECEDDVRVLWVLRDLLGVTGPKYGCGIGACQACTSHLNGRAVNICCIPVGRLKPSDRVTTIEGLGATVGKKLHPMQEAWLKLDVAQCGYCQPGQIMAAVAKVNEVRRAEGRLRITNKDIDEIRNVCRCGTYPRIRKAIREGAKGMPKPKRRRGRKKAKSAEQAAPRVATEPTTEATTAPTTSAAPTVPNVPAVPDVAPAASGIDLGVIKVK